MQCINWRPIEKNTLRGLATLQLASGLIIVDATLHEKNGSRWVSMPGKPWKDKDGSTKYAQVIDFIDKETRDRFSRAAVQAIDRFTGAQAEPGATDPWGDPV